MGADISASSVAPSWLLRAKVQVPVLPAGYVRHVSALQSFAGVLQRRLTALQAPAGFGKTTVLADIAWDLAQQRGSCWLDGAVCGSAGAWRPAPF